MNVNILSANKTQGRCQCFTSSHVSSSIGMRSNLVYFQHIICLPVSLVRPIKTNQIEYICMMFAFYSGTMFSVGVFSHLLQIDDSLIGVMSSMSKILASFAYAFAQTDWHLYMGK